MVKKNIKKLQKKLGNNHKKMMRAVFRSQGLKANDPVPWSSVHFENESQLQTARS